MIHYQWDEWDQVYYMYYEWDTWPCGYLEEHWEGGWDRVWYR